MKRPIPAHMVERARRLLAHERGDADGVEACATAVARVYDKLHAQLSPLVGSAGVQALLARSAKLAQAERAPLTLVLLVESSTKLHDGLREHEPAVVVEAGAALFGTFFALLTNLIGERLTNQALRSAWPTFADCAPKETEK